MACPFFVPQQILDGGPWQHPSRLPLGAGWHGHCCASGQDLAPTDAAIRDLCNLGYAAACPHLPAQRDWDAIRFSVARAGAEQVTLNYVCEAAHAPVEHGKLSFDVVRRTWLNPHPDPRVRRLAACYLQTYRARQSDCVI